MKWNNHIRAFAIGLVLSISGAINPGRTLAHDIYFCGEKIPVDDQFVAEKLMNIIKRQINYVNIPSIRESVKQYMSQVEYWLKETNLPQDLKYLAIVESGFRTDAMSPVGAAGFWQLMPKTAREYNLVVNGVVDERKYFDKSTYAACQLLANYYLDIRKRFGINSWVLTAAAYNVGIGKIRNAITEQGNNYFTMSLNAETAAYVYKIIAVKELFEYPELYMKNFGYNVFNTTPPPDKKTNGKAGETDLSSFANMKVAVDENDGWHPTDLKQKLKQKDTKPGLDVKLISAKIVGKYKHVQDSILITFKLNDDLQVINRFTAKDKEIWGRAWIIDDRVMVDLGYDHDVIVMDKKGVKGIPLSKLKNKETVILQVTNKRN